MRLPRLIVALFCTILLASMALVACSTVRGKLTPTPTGLYSVDPLFLPLYERLGGLKILGPAISPPFEKDGKIYQYTDAALMMYDPELPRQSRLRLAPLGRDLGIYELPPATAPKSQAYYVDGHLLYDKFVPLYERLGGKEVVGKALTDPHQNTEKHRFEQFFENVGFYWKEGDPPDAVHLLSYGAWRCDQSCRYSPVENSRLDWPLRHAAPFVKEIARLGLDFSGYALSEPYLAADGHLEQIYENIVLVVYPQNPEKVLLLNLPERVGFDRDPLQPPTLDSNMYFYPLQSSLGYNVPSFFMEYLQEHGGVSYLGKPVTQMHTLAEGIYQQCFENICLEARPDESGRLVVKPVALGFKYRDLVFQQPGAISGMSQSVDITMQIWEEYPMVSPGKPQEIGVVVYGNNLPLANVTPQLELSLPDGGVKIYSMPATGPNGETRVLVEPLQAKNGTLIPYKVCVAARGERKFCVIDSYLIWYTEAAVITPLPPSNAISFIPFVVKNAPVYISGLVNSFSIFLPTIFHGP